MSDMMEETLNKIKALKGVKACSLISFNPTGKGLRVHTNKLVMRCEGRNILVPEMVFDIHFSQPSIYGAIKFVGEQPHPIIGPGAIPSWGGASVSIGDAYRMGDYFGIVFLVLGCLAQEPVSAYAKSERFDEAKRLTPGWVV
jgi:hypothetical protein